MKFREGKATAIASYFFDKACTEQMEVLDLMKLMYAAERKSLHERLALLTGDAFVNMQLGPVMTASYDTIKGQRGDIWCQYFEALKGRNVRRIQRLDPSDVLTPLEITILDSAWDDLSPILGMAGTTKVAFIHNFFTEWKDPGPNSQTTLSLEDIIERGFNVDHEEAIAKANLVKSTEGLKEWLTSDAKSR